MAIDRTLLAILADPEDKGPLMLVTDEQGTETGLYNPRLHLLYPIEDGIPDLLRSDARELGEAEHTEVLNRAAASQDW